MEGDCMADDKKPSKKDIAKAAAKIGAALSSSTNPDPDEIARLEGQASKVQEVRQMTEKEQADRTAKIEAQPKTTQEPQK